MSAVQCSYGHPSATRGYCRSKGSLQLMGHTDLRGTITALLLFAEIHRHAARAGVQRTPLRTASTSLVTIPSQDYGTSWAEFAERRVVHAQRARRNARSASYPQPKRRCALARLIV
jgi:hypothetical protein